ncbi:hypothetical protein PTKIN_Ptkin07bG0051300 [Pterospermum kingtungense]
MASYERKERRREVNRHAETPLLVKENYGKRQWRTRDSRSDKEVLAGVNEKREIGEQFKALEKVDGDETAALHKIDEDVMVVKFNFELFEKDAE